MTIPAGGSLLFVFAPLSEMLAYMLAGWTLEGDLGDHHGEYSVLMSRPDSAPPRRAGFLPSLSARGSYELARWLRAAGRFFGKRT